MGSNLADHQLNYASAPVVRPDDIRRDGPFVVMPIEGRLPSRCIKCNATAGVKEIRKRLFWYDERSSLGGEVAFVPFIRLIFAPISFVRWIADLSTMRAPRVCVCLCRRHRLSCKALTAIAWLTPPTTAIAFWFLSGIGSIFLLLGAIALTAIAASQPRPVKAVHVGVGWITLRGAGERFLSTLPSQSRDSKVDPDSVVSSVSLLRERVLAQRKDPNAK